MKKLKFSKGVQKYPEDGRSMIEMIAVLAILIVIMCLSVMAFNFVKAKSKAQSTAKMITTLAKERQHVLKDVELQETKGPYEMLSLQDGKAGNRKKYFSISMNTTDTLYCEELKKSDFIQASLVLVNDKTDGTCPGKLEFFFLKNLSDGGTSLVYKDENGETKVCPEGGVCSDAENNHPDDDDGGDGEGNTFSCLEGYYKMQGACLKCPENATCTDDTPPVCNDGYYLKDKV